MAYEQTVVKHSKEFLAYGIYSVLKTYCESEVKCCKISWSLKND